MARLPLSIAIGDYDRNRALLSGALAIDGVEPVFMTLSPEEMFFRAFRHAAFDASELSLSSYVVSLTRPEPQYVALPVFLSRAFRHTAIYIRTDKGIARPQDLVGKRIGIAEYQLTANVWARALLEDEYGVRPSDVVWVRGGMETAGRPEKMNVAPPADVTVEAAPADRSLNQLMEAGEIDAYIGPRALSCFDRGHPQVARLFADPAAAATDYYARTGVFPIMHVLGLRRALAERHPWLPGALMKAFQASKDTALAALSDTSAAKVTLPFVEEALERARGLMGADFWSYGVAGNVTTLDTFLDHHHRQGLSPRRLAVAELFHPATMEAYSL